MDGLAFSVRLARRVCDGVGTRFGIRADPERRGGHACHDDQMGTTARVMARAVTWPLTPLLSAASFVVLLKTPDTAEPLFAPADVSFVVATLACWLVGVVLTDRVFEQPAGGRSSG